jgi:hypothetical protein
MEPEDTKAALELHSQQMNALMDNQFALVAQVQVLQAALASALMHHPDRQALLATFEKYMKLAKESAPQMAGRMEALEAGMLALLGKHQA